MTKQDAREVARTTEILTRALPRPFPSPEGSVCMGPVEDALTLHRIAGSLHRYDERECSEDLGCRRCQGTGEYDESADGLTKDCPDCAGTGSTIGKRVRSLEAKVQAIASAYGFRAYFQGDCRGCPLYLIPESYPASEDASAYSSRGVAVVWLG